MLKTALQIITLSLALVGLTHAQTGNPEAGRSKFHPCAGCHAIPGYTNAYPTYHVPRLAGQNAEYIVAALQSYKNGQRAHDTMHANAWDLDTQDMADIGAYLEQLGEQQSGSDKMPRIRGDIAAGEAKSAVCQACHGTDGVSQLKIYPHLAGQYEDYLQTALTHYRNGKRQNAIMSGFAGQLSDEDIRNLAAYYASRKPVLRAVDYSTQVIAAD